MFDLHVLRSKTFFAIIVLTFAVGSLTLRADTPTAPSNLTATVNGSNVTLSWTASANSPTSYVLQAGFAPGDTVVQASVSGSITSFSASGAPGTYYVRAIAFNNEGGSAPSNEVVVTLTCAPSAPLNFRAMMRGQEAYLFWRRTERRLRQPIHRAGGWRSRSDDPAGCHSGNQHQRRRELGDVFCARRRHELVRHQPGVERGPGPIPQQQRTRR